MSDTDSDLEFLTQPPNLGLAGRVAWLTGASRGLGRTLAFALAGAGAELVLSARSGRELVEVAELIRQGGGTAETVIGSVTDTAVIDRTTALIEQRWGKLDVLVNNAGVSTAFARAEQLEPSAWREVLEVNLSAPFACAVAALPLLERAGQASVVNISSIHGSRAHERLVAYAASKGGLEMVTRTLAVEWAARGVRVNAVAPAYLETEMTAGLRESPRWSEALLAHIPMRRFATTAEVAPAVLFLAGSASSYITGTTLYVDGGWSAA